ncbi:MAG TPA: pitrilysin family protein [Armatimonadota bacterium]|nr:pitrilysin family protein [Armatimonadota bacterium]
MRRRSLMLVGCMVGLVLALGIARAEPVVQTLDNGCRVIVEEDHSRPVAALRVYVGVGSAYEGRWLGAGMTHFLEHTLQEGTPTRTSEQIARLTETLGNYANAYTTSDHTCYYITTAGDMIGQAIDLYADCVLRASLPEEEVETQRGIILREMAMGDDDPGDRSYQLMAETMFRHHPSRYRIIGYPEAFKAVTREDLVEFHRLWYVPDNIVVVVVGDVDSKAVLAQLGETFGSAPRGAVPPYELVREPEQLAPRRRVEVRDSLQRAYLYVGWRTVSVFDPDMYPLDVLAYYLSAGNAAPLKTRLRDKLQLVDSVSAYSATPVYDAGSFIFSAVLDPDKLNEAQDAMLTLLDDVRTTPPSRADLARVQRQMEVAEVFGQQSVEDRAESLGRNLMVTGDEDFATRYLAGIKAVTPAQVQRVIEKYCRPERLCVSILSPRQPRAREGRETAPERASVTTSKVLSNGLTVVVRENHTQPLVAVTTATSGGLRYESAENAGITSLMARMLVQGAAGKTHDQIASAVDRVGGSLQPYGGRSSFGIDANFMAENLPLALQLTVDALFRPTFPQAELENQKRLALAAIDSRKDDVASYAFELLLAELYQVHPYHFPTSGTHDSVAGITREDLVRFHQATARAANTVLAVCGDASADDVFAQVEALTRGLSAEPQTPQTPPVEPPIQKPREETITRPQEQAMVCYGFHGLAAGDPDLAALDVLDGAFSGAGYPGGRLHDTLRGAQLVYFADAYGIASADPGPFFIYAGCAPDKVDVVRSEIERLVREITSEEISAEELERARGMCISEQEVNLQTNPAVSQTIAIDTLYGLGSDWWQGYAGRINAVTAADVLKVARRVLNLDRCAVVVTTPGPENQ